MNAHSCVTNCIVFINPQGQVEIINADGRFQRQLSLGEKTYQFPAWAPNGCAVAAIGNAGEEGSVRVWDIAADGQETDELPIYESEHQPPIYLYWSPNSRYVSFLATHPRAGIGLYLASRTQGPRLIGTGQPCFWMWRPDSEAIFLHASTNDALGKLGLMHQPFEYEVDNVGFPGRFQAPGISPSGRYLAFATIDEKSQGVVAIEDSRTQRRHSIRHEGAAILSWSPVEDRLAFISPINPARHFYGLLRLVDAKTGRAKILTNEVVLAFFWSPNGRRIAYITLARQGDNPEQMVIPEGYARGRPMPPSRGRSDIWLNLSVVDLHSGRAQLLSPFQPHPVFLNQLLPFFDQYALSHRLWSPDSRLILLSAIADQTEQIVIVPVDGMPPLAVAQGTMASWSHQ